MKRFTIGELQHYMLTKEHIMSLVDEYDSSNKPKTTEKTTKKLRVKKKAEQFDNFIHPKHKDSLFWCYYMLTAGLFSYETIGDRAFIEEKGVKIQIVEDLKNHKDLLKKNKWKRTQIESELVSATELSLKTFLCICAIKQINVVVLKGRCLYIPQLFPSNKYELVVFGEHGFMLSQHDDEQNKRLIDEYTSKYWLVENISKPLAAISSYKVGTLKDICKRLNISIVSETGKRYNKRQLYDMINCKI